MQKGTLKPEDMEPDIGPFGFYIDAFHELSSCRINGMSLGPIPFTAIVEYSKIFDVGCFDEFLYYMRSMDKAIMKLASKDLEAKSKASKSKGKAKNAPRR